MCPQQEFIVCTSCGKTCDCVSNTKDFPMPHIKVILLGLRSHMCTFTHIGVKL